MPPLAGIGPFDGASPGKTSYFSQSNASTLTNTGSPSGGAASGAPVGRASGQTTAICWVRALTATPSGAADVVLGTPTASADARNASAWRMVRDCVSHPLADAKV